MKRLFQDAKPGLYLSLAAGAIALVGAVAYVIIYMAAAGETVDRVFSWLTLGLMLGGAAVTLAGEALKLPFTPILGGACFAVGLSPGRRAHRRALLRGQPHPGHRLFRGVRRGRYPQCGRRFHGPPQIIPGFSALPGIAGEGGNDIKNWRKLL